MFINSINNTFFSNIQSNNKSNNQSKFGLKMSAPLTNDVVSFQATKKVRSNDDKKYGVSLEVARQIHDEVEDAQPAVKEFLTNTWGKYLVTNMNPRNPILKFEDRAKRPLSIMEKSQTRHWNSKKEVLENMTDLNGGKIVMRDASKIQVDNILSELIIPIKKGEIELIEIENKRPIITKGKKGNEGTKYDYASRYLLEDLKNIQEEKNKTSKHNRDHKVKLDLDDYTDINYSAIHMLLKLRGQKRPFELTLMGADVSQLKDLDDKLFKILNGKEVESQYEPIVKIVQPLTEEGNQEQLEKFNKYRGDAMIFQRIKEPSSYSLEKRPVYFLPMTEDLDPKLDLNELYKVMVRCDKSKKEDIPDKK